MAWDVPTTATVGQVLTAAFWNAEVKGNMDYLKGGIGSWTPQIDQGVTTNIAKTLIEARYTRVGDICHAWFGVNITGTGTAGSAATSTLPIAQTGHAVTSVMGSGLVYDASATTRYQGQWELTTTTTIGLGTNSTGGGLAGGTPSFALGASDSMRGLLTYHVA